MTDDPPEARPTGEAAGQTVPAGFASRLIASRASVAGWVAFAVFCLAAVWIWVPRSNQTQALQTTGEMDVNVRLREHRATLAELISVTGDRPLFQMDRRPLAAPEAPEPPAEAVLVLVGILVDGTERLALVRRSTSPELFQIEVGGRLGPWQILEVDEGSISVRKDDGSTFSLRLDG